MVNTITSRLSDLALQNFGRSQLVYVIALHQHFLLFLAPLRSLQDFLVHGYVWSYSRIWLSGATKRTRKGGTTPIIAIFRWTRTIGKGLSHFVIFTVLLWISFGLCNTKGYQNKGYELWRLQINHGRIKIALFWFKISQVWNVVVHHQPLVCRWQRYLIFSMWIISSGLSGFESVL